jgi:chemotaxis protein histidine kinase CheA
MMPLTNDDASDGEIIDIFAEEAQEVLERMDRDLAVWRARPGDQNALQEIRRGFHTLKGSGRMVKAMDLGELAWKVENMLNRALDGAVPVTDSMLQLVVACRAVIPRLLDALKKRRKPEMISELEALMSRADALAGTQGTAAPAARPAAATAGDQALSQVRINELQRKLDRATQRIDEALQRSEMALHQVRRLAADISALQSPDRIGRAELTPIIERVNAIGKELSELRHAAKRAQGESAPHPRELLQSIDHRIREKLAPTERFRSEVEREIQANRRAAASARNLAIWAILISLALLGGAVIAMLVGTAGVG